MVLLAFSNSARAAYALQFEKYIGSRSRKIVGDIFWRGNREHLL